MKTTVIICDGCKRNIENSTRGSIVHYLTLKDETLEREEGGLQTLARDYPIIEGELTFHDLQCLSTWAMNQ